MNLSMNESIKVFKELKEDLSHARVILLKANFFFKYFSNDIK